MASLCNLLSVSPLSVTVDETPYLLKDKAKEAELGDTLTAILARAEKKKALHDRKVYISKKAHTDIGILMRIVSACGGIVSHLPHLP